MVGQINCRKRIITAIANSDCTESVAIKDKLFISKRTASGSDLPSPFLSLHLRRYSASGGTVTTSLHLKPAKCSNFFFLAFL